MPSPDREADDPDTAAHDALVAVVQAIKDEFFPDGSSTTLLNVTFENKAIVAAILAVGLMLDKRLAMSERQRG